MTDKTGRRNRSKRNKWLLISAIAIFLVLISALAAYSYINQTDKPIVVYAANTYFAISDLAGTYQTTGTTYNGTGTPPLQVLLTSLDFTFTPVGGDATDTRIFMQGMTEPETTWWANTIKNGTSIDAASGSNSTDIELGSGVPVYRQADGTYTFPILMQADNVNGQIDVNGTINLIFNANASSPDYNFVSLGQYNPS